MLLLGTFSCILQSSETSHIITMNRNFFFTLILVVLGAYGLHWAVDQCPLSAQIAGNNPSLAKSMVPMDTTPLSNESSGRIVSYADVLDDVTPAVVAVYPKKIVRQYERQQSGRTQMEEFLRRYYNMPIPEQRGEVREYEKPQGIGSGVIVSSDGYIVTNHHVITDDYGQYADQIEIALNDDRSFSAKIVGSDEKTDVAVLKVDAEDLPYLQMADSRNLRVGDIVFAVGNPLGVGLTVTQGIVSAVGRTDIGILGRDGYEDFIQTDASINPGNSGGALVDAAGRLVGINSAILSRTGSSIGIGFAIPSHLVRTILTSIVETGSVRRGYIGVYPGDLTSELAESFGYGSIHGAVVNRVQPGGPADSAGILNGDIITTVDGIKVNDAAGLRLTVSAILPGTEVLLGVFRDGRERDIKLILGDLDGGVVFGGGKFELLKGIIVEPVTEELRNANGVEADVEGLIISEIKSDSPFRLSLRKGMVIMEINGQPAEAKTAQSALQRGINRLWAFERGGYGFVTIQISE